MAGQRAIGVISVQSTQAEGRFSDDDVRLLTTIAATVGAAIENARLFQEIRQRANEMAALAEIGRDVSATLDLPTVLERIANHAKELLHGRDVVLRLLEPDGRLPAVVTLGKHAEVYTAWQVHLGYGLTGHIAQSGVAEIVNDPLLDPRVVRIAGTEEDEEHEAMILAPLIARDQVIGVLTVWRDKVVADTFGQSDLDFAVGLARQAAIAIENARLFADAGQARAQAEEARAAAESANVAKSTFLANMSHELRTPLNAVLGFAQLMERDPALAPRQREHLGIIAGSGEHLLTLINDVLEISKIEAGQITLNEAPFDLRALLRSVEELFHLRTESKQVQLRFEVAPDVPQYVAGDESKLRQILINLLGNAVKFTQVGGVTLRAIWHAQLRTKNQEPSPAGSTENQECDTGSRFSVLGSGGSSLVVEVEDTGAGIAAGQLPSLFQPFVQTDSGVQAHEGSGLGLTITRQFVQLMGGDVTVTSTFGQGSVFRFDVRLTPIDQVPAPHLAERRVVGVAGDGAAYRMLVVDDRWENRRLLVEWLGAAGFAVREASNGQEAIAAWEVWEPHLIWMDMRMPVMDGYEATRRIKATLKGQATVIVALTASTFEHEQAIVLSAGCDDFVRKPVREAVVFEKIAQHLGVQFVYAEPPASGAASGDGVASLRAALVVLPEDWVARLKQAVLMADMEQVKALARQIHARDHVFADGIERLADDLRLDQLYRLIQA